MKLNSAIASARAHLKYKNFNTLVKLCQLSHINTWETWQDDSENKICLLTLKITKSKDLISKDIYQKSHFTNIYNNSYWIYLNNDIVWVIGNDNVLRACVVDGDLWVRNEKPLLLGFDMVKGAVDRFVSRNNTEEFGFKVKLKESLKEKVCRIS